MHHRNRQLLSIGITGVLLATSTQSGAGQGADGPRPKIDASAVAKAPAPGTVVPGAIAFAPDGKSVTYLKAESASLSRVLWRASVADGTARVVARPPGGGDTDATVSREEALRRERQRLRETGITQVARARDADVTIIPLGGDLYALRGDGPLVRLTATPTPELDPKPSPDGTRAAFVRGGDLYAIDLATKAEIRLTEGATDGLTHGLAEFMAQEEMDRSTGFWWSPDGARIAYQEADERAIPAYPIVHQGGAEPVVETHRYPFPGAKNAAVRLGVVSSRGGPTTWLDLPAADPADFYLARVDWEDAGHLLVQLLDRAQKTLTLCRVDVERNAATVLLKETSPTWVNLHNDLRPVAGTGEVVWSTERSGFRHLVLLDHAGQVVRELTTGQVVRELTTGDWAVDGVDHLDARRREVWFSAGVDRPLERQVYRVSLDGGPIHRVTAEPGTHRVTVAHDSEHYVDVFSNRSAPPTTRLLDLDGRVVAVLDDSAANDARVAELHLAPPEIHSFRGPDGVEMFGAFYPPRSEALGRKAPLIVLLYGGPHVQYVSDAWAMTADLNAQALADRGFAVWKMDNRGSARRGVVWESAIFRSMGTVEVRDQVAGVRFIAGRHPDRVDAGRVGVSGSSYGGYMTLRCLTEAPETFRAGVAVAPVTDWDGYDTCYTERYMETPRTNPDGYKASSVLGAAGRLRGSLLLVHGMIDENVHYRHTARLVAALIAADRPFEMLPLPEERHSSRKEEGRRYVAERLARFFERALAPGP